MEKITYLDIDGNTKLTKANMIRGSAFWNAVYDYIAFNSRRGGDGPTDATTQLSDWMAEGDWQGETTVDAVIAEWDDEWDE